MSNPLLRAGKPATTSDAFPLRKLAPNSRSEVRLRPLWRQRLVDAERGLSHSFKADSALYLHLFFDSLLLATCFVLGLSTTHWVIVALALTIMLSGELFAQGLTALASESSERLRRQVTSIAAAAKTLAFVGSTSAISIVLLLRFRELFGG